jgi:VCBS repeat-containing protein
MASKVARATTNANPFTALFFNATPSSLADSRDPGQGPNGVVTGTLSATDGDSDTLTYNVTSEPSYGSVTLDSDGRYAYTPYSSAAASGVTDSFSVAVSDAVNGFHIHGLGGLLNLLTFGVFGNGGHTATRALVVTVAPFLSSGAVVVGPPDPVTGIVVGSVSANNPDGKTLSFGGSTATAKGSVTVDANSGAFTYTPTAYARHAAARNGASFADVTDNFTVTISDGQGAAATVPVTVTVSPFNSNPVGTLDFQNTADPLTGIVTGMLTVADSDGDAVYYSVPFSTSKGVITYTPDGSFTYTPTDQARDVAASSSATAADMTDTFSVTFTDDYGGWTAVPVTVEVIPAIPPVTVSFAQGSASTVEGDSGSTLVPLTVKLSGPASAPVTVRYEVVEQPLLSTAATPYVDFKSETGSVTIPVGQTEGTFMVTIYGDTTYESSEVLRVELTGVTGGVLDSSYLNYRKTVTITNDDQPSAAALVRYQTVLGAASSAAVRRTKQASLFSPDSAVTSV